MLLFIFLFIKFFLSLELVLQQLFKLWVCSEKRERLFYYDQKTRTPPFLFFVQKKPQQTRILQFFKPEFSLLLNVEQFFNQFFIIWRRKLQIFSIFAFFSILSSINLFRVCLGGEESVGDYFFFCFFFPPWRMATNKGVIKTRSRVNVSPFWPEFLVLQMAPWLCT